MRSSIAETWGDGEGVIDGSCSGPMSLTSYGSYVRIGIHITSWATVTVSDGSRGHLAMDCVFEPAQTPPATFTSYSLTCSVSFEGLV
jgi:hypothetical protein